MGDVSIIARRHENGMVEYGWSGNGGYFNNTGARLLEWYNDKNEEIIDNLFSLGQLKFIGKPGSEYGGYTLFYSHKRTGEPHWLGKTEREIFSKIAFIDYGYFYDLDKQWYYIIPGPFRIKIPLELIENNLDENGYEFTFREEIEKLVMDEILLKYPLKHDEFKKLLNNQEKEIYSELINDKFPIENLWDKYPWIFRYFDDWVLIVANNENTTIQSIEMRKKTDIHIETNKWYNE